MSDNKIIQVKIGQIEFLLSEIKRELGVSEKDNILQKQKTIKKVANKTRKPGSTQPIQKLIDDGIFRTPQTLISVQQILKKKALLFEVNDIAVTLMRFVRKGILVREGEGNTKSPWNYKKQ